MARPLAAPRQDPPAHLRSERVRLADGRATTVHVAEHDLARTAVPFDAPFDSVRGCLAVSGGRVALERREALRALPRGDLLQAGPLLLDGGVPCVAGDPEGFASGGARQFDSDITDGRHPRAAVGLTGDGRLLAVACDGRDEDEAGLTLQELAEVLAALGALRALNLDGGGSTTLVCGGVLRNVPREAEGVVVPGGRAVSTAVTFAAR